MKKHKIIKEKIMNNENNKNIFVNVLGSFLVKGGSLLISLLTMPAYINYFNNELVLGTWFTMLSVLSWILTFDLGIGNGLRNHLVPELIKNDKEEIRKYISSAYIIISIIVTIILAVALPTFRFLDWNALFNISEFVIERNALANSVSIVFSGIMIHFLLKLINSILFAMQKSALNNFLSLISSVLIYIYLWLAPEEKLSISLIRLSLIHVLSVNLPLLFGTIYVFSNKLRYSIPSIKFYKRTYAKKVLTLGGTFFWVQIMYMLITSTNEFLITWLSSPSDVVEYQIYIKLFTLIGSLFTLALTPVWSAVTKAFSENNLLWINTLYQFLKKMALLAVVLQFALIVFLQFGINIWLGSNTIEVNYLYAVIFAFFGSIFIWNGVLSSIANGLGELRTQRTYYTIGVVLKFIFSLLLVSLTNSWIGIILANIISLGLYSVVQPYRLNKILKEKIGGLTNV